MLKVKKLVEKFKLDVINADNCDLSRIINKQAIHRHGLELIGKATITGGHKNVIGWGTKESNFFNNLSSKELNAHLERVLNADVPLIILSVGVTSKIVEKIVKVADKYNIPVVKSSQHLAHILMTIGWYIVKYLAESVDIHGSLVVVNGVGVMIIGKSGIGKSEAVLELIHKGSMFVSDDTVVLKRIGTDFIGEPAKLTKNFLEARGIGFIDIAKIYGLKSTKDSANINLVVELLPSEELNNVDRLGNQNLKYEVLGGTIDKIQIPVENGRTLSSLIEAAVNTHIAKRHGHDAFEIIKSRQK